MPPLTTGGTGVVATERGDIRHPSTAYPAHSAHTGYGSGCSGQQGTTLGNMMPPHAMPTPTPMMPLTPAYGAAPTQHQHPSGYAAHAQVWHPSGPQQHFVQPMTPMQQPTYGHTHGMYGTPSFYSPGGSQLYQGYNQGALHGAYAPAPGTPSPSKPRARDVNDTKSGRLNAAGSEHHHQ